MVSTVEAFLKTCPEQKCSIKEVFNVVMAKIAALTRSDGFYRSSGPNKRKVRLVDLKRLLRKAELHHFVLYETPSRHVAYVQLNSYGHAGL